MLRPRLLILTLIFPPDGVSTSQLLGEIAQDLHSTEFQVSVLTTSPHYNVDHEAQRSQPISWNWHRLTGTSEFHGIRVTHIRMTKKASSRVARATQWAWFHIASLIVGASRRRGIDVILTVSPPPTIALVAWLLNKLSGSPFVFGVWELYPEILVKLGKLKSGSILHRLLQVVERQTYRGADAITVLHFPMKAAVISALPSVAQKVRTIPTFADTEFLRPIADSSSFREAYGLDDKFVVGYAGNLGVSQDLTSLMRAAKLLKQDTSIVFLIAGDGSEKTRLEDMAEENGLLNVVFTGHLPYSLVPEITAACDLCVVTLAKDVSDEALPSKVYRVMACGKPILAITSQPSPLSELVTTFDIGVVASPDDPSMLVEVITSSRVSKGLEDAGCRARQLAVEKFSRKVVMESYREIIRSVLAKDDAQTI